MKLVVGLGNPGRKYHGTRHNVGFEVVERLAQGWALEWVETPRAWIAKGVATGVTGGEVRRYPVCLVKFRSEINHTGSLIAEVFGDARFEARRCILVFDDLAIPLGDLRQRFTGGAGGHKGAASVLHALQTDQVRRLKLGIGNSTSQLDRGTYVTIPLDSEGRARLETAMAMAQARMFDLLSQCPKPTSKAP